MQAERGESMLTLFGRAMKAQMIADAMGQGGSEFDTLGLIRILMSRDSATEFKRSLARQLGLYYYAGDVESLVLTRG